MKRVLLLLPVALGSLGCSSGANNSAEAPNTPPVTEGAPLSQPTAQGAGGVAPMASGAAGGMTPIAGSDSVQGPGGGSTSMAAKGWAKDKINSSAGGSMSQMPSEEGN